MKTASLVCRMPSERIVGFLIHMTTILDGLVAGDRRLITAKIILLRCFN